MSSPDFSNLVCPELSYKLTGVFFAVHNERGRFCNEKQYADCLECHLKKLKVRYEREKVLPQSFESELPRRNKVDFLVEDKVIVELKAKRVLERTDYYQVKRYLIAMNKKLGFLVNFRDKYLRPKRVLNSEVKQW